MSETNNQENFKEFGKHFQDKVMHALVVDHKWGQQMMGVLQPDHFEHAYLKFISKLYISHYKKYKVLPSLSLLAGIVQYELKNGSDSLIKEQILELFKQIKSKENLGDLPFVKEKSLEFCRTQNVKNAILKSVNLMEEGKFEQITDIIGKSISSGRIYDMGIELDGNVKDRYKKTQTAKISTGIKKLDDEIQGGVSRGTLNCIAMSSGVGKSHFLVQIGCSALRQHLNVVHISYELNPEDIAIRYDSNFLDINSELLEQNIEKVESFYSENKNIGKLKIKYFDRGTCTADMIADYLDSLAATDFIADILIIDYAEIGKAIKETSDTRSLYRAIYEEIRNLAVKRDLVAWTASQVNAIGVESDFIDIQHLQEGKTKADVLDSLFTFSIRPENRKNGLGLFYIAKVRKGITGILFDAVINTARSKFDILKYAVFEPTVKKKSNTREFADRNEKIKSEKILTDSKMDILKEKGGISFRNVG